MNQFQLIETLLKDNNLSNSIPISVQKQIIKDKKNTLLFIYKKFKKYSLFILLCINIYFLLKKVGLSLSFAKIYFITIVVSSSVIISSTSTVSYIIIKEVIYKDQTNEQEKKSIDNLSGQNNINIKNKSKNSVIKNNYLLQILPFEYESNLKNIELLVRKSISKEINKLKGKNASILSSNKSNNNTKKALLGSIFKENENYVISIKVIDKKTTKIILYISEQFKTIKNIDKACEKLTKKIVKIL